MVLSMASRLINIAKYHFYQRWKDHGWKMPAHDFERESGVKGIARDYLMPEGHTMQSVGERFIGGMASVNVQNILLRYDYQVMRTLFQKAVSGESAWENKMLKTLDEIIELNPELQAIQYGKTSIDETYHVLCGLCSGFNPDDINHYLSGCRNGRTPEYFDARVYARMLGDKIGFDFLWIPSSATTEKIKAHFGLENWEPSAAEMAARKKEIFGSDVNIQPDIQ
jgi:hypothetical protein